MVAPSDDVLRARGLHCAYGGVPVLVEVSLSVRPGEVLAVTGPRGCGKSTLLACLSGRLVPRCGEVWFGDVPVHSLSAAARGRLRRAHFGWIGGEPQLLPELTAWENVALPALLSGGGRRAARRAAHQWLERLDVGDCARRRPGALRQAQRQRVAVARALAHSPDVVLADEPTAPLHRTDGMQVLRTLTAVARSHCVAVVLASHDPQVAGVADRAVALLDGHRVDSGAVVAAAPEAGVGAACSSSF